MSEQEFWDKVYEESYRSMGGVFFDTLTPEQIADRIAKAAACADKALKLRRGESND